MAIGELPDGYDHKYTYSHLGYNLKPLDVQAAIGRVQIRRLPSFIVARKSNWQFLRSGLSHLEDKLDFALPSHATRWSSTENFLWIVQVVKPIVAGLVFQYQLSLELLHSY